MKLYYELMIKYHEAMKKFYLENLYFRNQIKSIFHDMRVQRYENKLEKKQ